MRFTAIDFETANAGRGSVCAVGLVLVDNGNVVARVSQLIRPEPLVFDPFNVSIHGLSEADVADAPTFATLWPSLWERVSGPLVAHNAAFDMSVLRHALDQAGQPYPETDYFCTRVISRLVWPQHPTYGLDYIAQAIGIRFRHHDAQEDAHACALIALAACEQANVGSLHDLQDAIGLRVGRMCNNGYSPCGGACAPRCRTDHREKLRTADIAPTLASRLEGGPCFGMAFVFTGALASMHRKDAMQAVVDRGGTCHDAVKSETDFLVLGQDGFVDYRAGRKTSKMRKAEELRSRGLPIEIIAEADFLGML